MALSQAVLDAGWARGPGAAAAPAAVLRFDSRQRGAAGPVLVGLDVGGTKIHAASWTPGRIRETLLPTRAQGGLAVVDDIHATVQSLVGDSDLRGVTVGLPGTLDPLTGHLEQAPNLPRWNEFDVRAELSQRFGAPVRIENDVDLAAAGEHAWTGEESLVFVAIGTGIGVGIVVRGRIWRGTTGAAGEVYDVPLPATVSGPSQLEDVVCGAGLEQAYRAVSGRDRSTREILHSLSTDEAAVAALDDVARPLADFVAAVHALLDPAVIVLGGGLGAREELLEATRKQLTAHRRRPVPLRGSLLGSHAATVGAIALAAQPD